MKTKMKSPWLPLILTVLLTLGLAACGKKGPPVPPDDEPKKESPATPQDSGSPY
jgi:predicted small lipoprotein YifL